MLVDSTALPEQVVGDVISSAFLSAGQRCSALRLLCLHEDIAEATLEMLKGAMAELTIGDPSDPFTDIGPVIDEAAKAKLDDHVARLANSVLYACPLPSTAAGGYFVAPTLIKLDCIEDLDRETFGPILHVVTWKSGALEATARRVMALGYGLTWAFIAASAARRTPSARSLMSAISTSIAR